MTFDFQCSPESQNGTGECCSTKSINSGNHFTAVGEDLGIRDSDSRAFAKQVSLFSPHTNTPVGVQGGQIPSLLFYFPSLDSELVNRNANAPEDGRETGDSALGCK